MIQSSGFETAWLGEVTAKNRAGPRLSDASRRWTARVASARLELPVRPFDATNGREPALRLP